jgi:transcriptional regulatory protein RtcR
MSTFSPKGRIDGDCVDAEILRLKRLWSADTPADDGLPPLLSPEKLAALDPFDRVQLSHVVTICRASRTLSEAGRTLFAASRARRTSSNDADRLRKYLQRFGLEWSSFSS